MTNNGKIFVGIPRERFSYNLFIDNRDDVLTRLSEIGRLDQVMSVDGHRVDMNRDSIVESFLARETEPEWLLMMDTDMDHPPTAPERLTSYGIPIVGALYFHRALHAPFVFEYFGLAEDKWGRMTNQWTYLREKVYDFLTSNEAPAMDGHLILDNCIGDPVIKCDAVGTGCIVIHRDVFLKMPGPWFEYLPGGGSEDVMFCKKARDLGFEVAADLSTICGHYHPIPLGQIQFRQAHEQRGAVGTRKDTDNGATLLASFYKISTEDARQQLINSNAHVVGDYWREWSNDFEIDLSNSDEVKRFYEMEQVGKLYILELLHWNRSEFFWRFQASLLAIRRQKVVEIGSGIGTISMQLAIQTNDVIAVEPNKILREFTHHRWKELRKQIDIEEGSLQLMDGSWIGKLKNGTQNFVVSIDVFEHIPEKELKETLREAHRILKIGGRLVFHANWYQQDLYPMHYNHSSWFDSYCKSIGFTFISEIEMVKSG